MKKSLLFVLGLVIVCITSCEYKIVDPIIVEAPDGISFATDIQAIFDDKCISCHTSRNPVLTEGNSYESLTEGGYIDTDNPTSSEIYIKVSSEGHHSSNPLSPMEQAYLLKWIEEGAEDN